MDITRWLEGLGLEQYQHAFREGDVDAAVLPELTADDLSALGVISLGHRRKLLAAIANLRPGTRSAPNLVAAGSKTVSPECMAGAGAERRQVTIMFCDLVGSTTLSLELDPEDLWQVIGAYHSCVTRTIRRYDGFVAKYMGDGVLVYFGYPQAHEDDAERAVRAGLALVDAAAEIATANRKLAVRIGIGTGMVVIGDLISEGSAQEQAVIGETPNLAARLQAVAGPNMVVIGPRTRRLLGDLFAYRDLGPVELKGFTEPGRAYQVLYQSGIESRFEALHSAQLTPLVGREQEIKLLLRCWRQATSGNGQIVLLSGEPGIGKSRIASALSETIQTEPHTRWRYFCSPYHQDSALYPFIVHLERAAGLARDDMAKQKLRKLQRLVAPGARGDREIALLADLLSLPNSSAKLNLSPRRKREMLFKALLHQFEAVAQDRPAFLVFEDVHWIDPTSRELLDLMLDRVSGLPVLVVIAFRPEFDHAWSGQRNVTTLALDRLGEGDGAALVQQIVGEATLSREIVDEIVERGDGVPLFLEELTKAVLERAIAGAQITAPPPTSLTIPETLHASLMARLDRLGSAAKEIAQMGAAIGRKFSYELLAVLNQRGDAELQEAVSRLVDAGLVFQRGTPPEATFLFKHALVRDAAHSTLLRRPRRELHAQIAAALETHFPELMESQPELFAQHYAEAGLVEKSVACWGKAGNRSAARSAMAEATAQLEKALEQLALLPDTPERQRQELEFRTVLAVVLDAVKGFAATETGQAFARARELWERLGSPPEFLQVPFGQSLYHEARGEFDRAQRLNDDLQRLSRHRNDCAGLVLGHLATGRNLRFAGKFSLSRSHLEEMLSLYDPIAHQLLVHHAGFHPQVNARAHLGLVLFCFGFPDQALAQIGAAIAEARRLAHPPSLASALASGATVLSLVGDNAALAEWTDQLVAVATEQGFPHWRAQGTIFRGWVKVRNGDVEAGISLLRSGSTAYRATGAELWVPYQITLLVRACEIAGQIEEALTQLADALHIVERTGERWLNAELYRQKGQLLLRQGHIEAAEELYRKALGIAAEQEAKLWELRAAVSLTRLRYDQGRPAEARDLLAPVYKWFTEGFDTPDLKDAKALLEALNP
jgi:class 3 adenylate cyclase/predicted ATPase